MRKEIVNISVNKGFKILAEALLTTNPQFIHQLLTELSTACHQASDLKAQNSCRAKIIREHNALTCAVIHGWRLGIRGEVPPTNPSVIEHEDTEIDYLIIPFITMGYKVACQTVETLLNKGWHRSQAQMPLRGIDAPPLDGTNRSEPPPP